MKLLVYLVSHLVQTSDDQNGFFFIQLNLGRKSEIGHIRILGIGLELAWNGGSCGGISLKRDQCHLHLKRFPRISLGCMLVPVQYREYEYGLLERN